MLPILFNLGPITVYSFGFFLVLAYFLATFILWREGKRQGYNEEKLLDLSVISLVSALIGGRIYYVILNWDIFVDAPTSIFAFWQGGFAFHGSLLAVLLVGMYFIHRWKWSFFQIADIASIGAAGAMVVGKIGAFFAGVDFGSVSGLPWALKFPDLIGNRHPVQLYEAGAYFVIFVSLYILYFAILGSRNMASGKVFFAFLITTSIARVGLEFFRADPHKIFLWPTATIASLIVAAAALFALYYFQMRDVKADISNVIGSLFGINSMIFKRFKL